METITIDAAKRSLGRVATEAATALRGKNRASFQRHLLPNLKVEITNAGQVSLTGRKRETMTHTTYSGYPGGLKIRSVKQVAAKKGQSELLRHAIYGMLPKNRLRDELMKRLTIHE